jgi:putative CocE/NonD family hydrolase
MTAPTKAVIGPWTHGPDIKNDEIAAKSHSWIVKVEALRWYDYWLKGIQNGILDEPRVQFAIEGKTQRVGTWLAENQWPSSQVKRQDFFFDIDSKQQQLSPKKPSLRQREARYTVDYSATTGQLTRYWDGLGQGPLHYPEMSEFNSKALVYTGDALAADTVVAGVPVVKLQMTADVPDSMVYVYLEKVYPDGRSVYVSDGSLLASWRNNLSKKVPYKNFGLPYYSSDRSLAEKAPPLSAGKTELTIPMHPAGMLFEKGTRLRVAISGADADSFYQKPLNPAPTFTVYSGGFKPSKITLPLLKKADQLRFTTWVEE